MHSPVPIHVFFFLFENILLRAKMGVQDELADVDVEPFFAGRERKLIIGAKQPVYFAIFFIYEPHRSDGEICERHRRIVDFNVQSQNPENVESEVAKPSDFSS